MILNQRNKFISPAVVFVLMVSFLFCCGASWNGMLSSENHTMNDSSACGMGDVGSQSTSGPGQFIVFSVSSFLNNFNIVLSVALVSVFLLFFLKFDVSLFYFKRVRERYGSFRWFDNFVNLFRLGILNPKTF